MTDAAAIPSEALSSLPRERPQPDPLFDEFWFPPIRARLARAPPSRHGSEHGGRRSIPAR